MNKKDTLIFLAKLNTDSEKSKKNIIKQKKRVITHPLSV